LIWLDKVQTTHDRVLLRGRVTSIEVLFYFGSYLIDRKYANSLFAELVFIQRRIERVSVRLLKYAEYVMTAWKVETRLGWIVQEDELGRDQLIVVD